MNALSVKSILITKTILFALLAFYQPSLTHNHNSWKNPDWQFAGLANLDVRVISNTTTGIIYAGTNNGLFKSIDYGNTWINCTGSVMQNDIMSIFISGSDVWVGSKSGLFHSDNSGSSWTLKFSSPVSEGFLKS